MNAKLFQAYFYIARLLTPRVMVTARIPMAQSALEAGSTWNSHMATAYNNLFGMTKPALRKHNGNGVYTTPGGVQFLTFASPYAAIRDYLMFLDQLGLYTNEKLQAYIDAGKYTHDAGYQKALARVIKEQAPLLVNPIQAAGVVTVAGIATLCGISLALDKLK